MREGVVNPFARGRMPLDGRAIRRAANEFVGHDEHIISTGRVVALHYGAYHVETFGRAWGNVYLYEGGNLQEDGYLSYDALLSLRDLGTKIYEVRYGEQDTDWDERYYGKYECYGKRVRDGIVTLAKWGDCAERWINLSGAEYEELCAGIEKMPDHHAHFEHYRTRVRPRARGEHRYFLWARAEGVRRVDDGKRDQYGRRCYGWGHPVMPFDHGYGSVDYDHFLLGAPDVWTASCSESAIALMLYPGRRGRGGYGKPGWDEIRFTLTHYDGGLFAERCRFCVYELLPAVRPIASTSCGSLSVPHRYQAERFTRILWDEVGVRLFQQDCFADDTPSIWLTRDLWEWISRQFGEFECWYNAVDSEQKEREEATGVVREVPDARASGDTLAKEAQW